MRSDKELLDFLESKSNGSDWVVRHSTTGRGYRLHNTSSPGVWGSLTSPRSARGAINQAMDQEIECEAAKALWYIGEAFN